MRLLVLALSLLVSVNTFANAQVELGKYRAVDKATKTVVANLTLAANSSVKFSLSSPDITIEGCEGSYEVKGNIFTASVTCPSILFPEASVTIDIKNVNPQTLRSQNGAEVDVSLEGQESETFLLKKND